MEQVGHHGVLDWHGSIHWRGNCQAFTHDLRVTLFTLNFYLKVFTDKIFLNKLHHVVIFLTNIDFLKKYAYNNMNKKNKIGGEKHGIRRNYRKCY